MKNILTVFLLTIIVLSQSVSEIYDNKMVDVYPLWKAKKYDKVLLVFNELESLENIELLNDRYINLMYNFACLHSIQGNKDSALSYLEKAVKKGYSNYKHILKDSDLNNIKETDEFKLLVSSLKKEVSSGEVYYSKHINTSEDQEVTPELNIAGLSKFWAEAKYNFAFFDQVTIDWDSLYIATIPKAREAKTALEFFSVLADMNRHLKDGHTNLWLPKNLRSKVNARPPFRAKLIENRVFVSSILDKSMMSKDLYVGLEVLEIDGVDVHEYAKQNVSAFFDVAGTPQERNVRLYEYGLFAGDLDDEIEITFKHKSGETATQSFDRTMKWYKQDNVEFKKYDDVAYLGVHSFSDNSVPQKVDSLFQYIKDSKALIIDLRENGGGNTPYWLLRSLAKKPFLGNAWMTRKNVSAQRAWGRSDVWDKNEPNMNYPNKEKHYGGEVIVLIGSKTFSAAEDFASIFDHMERGKIIGSVSAGGTGQPLFFKLPYGGFARVCSKRDTYPDGTLFTGFGIKPDITVHQTVADLLAGKDTVLDYALNHLDSKF